MYLYVIYEKFGDGDDYYGKLTKSFSLYSRILHLSDSNIIRFGFVIREYTG